MRLINTSTGDLEIWSDNKFRTYAIVSHCWGDEHDPEVTLQKYRAEKGKANRSDNGGGSGENSGWKKIDKACEIARNRNIEWVWIDTCCIDKNSETGLSEAINSMFEWYRASKECYVFMPDVGGSTERNKDDGFTRSRWFTRGWTLQELLAPWTVIFYNQYYQQFGTKTSLAKQISEVTGIEGHFLDPWQDVQEASVAQRMSWAANRETTRPEDKAYALLGLFGVNMPLLYGEGDRSFLRLQLEIIKQCEDDTIFAWPQDPDDEIHEDESCGLLAQQPKAFQGCGAVISTYFKSHPPHAFTSRGVQLHVLRQWFEQDLDRELRSFKDTEIAVGLDCVERRETAAVKLAIILRRSKRTGVWYRRGCVEHRETRTLLPRLAKYAPVYVPQPELGQVVPAPSERDRVEQASTRLLTYRLICRWSLVMGGLFTSSYLFMIPGVHDSPLTKAATGLCLWSFWTMLWVGMGSSISSLLEMLTTGFVAMVVFSYLGTG